MLRTFVAFCLAAFAGLAGLGLTGCATVPRAEAPVAVPWLDAQFSYSPALVTVDRDELFRLPPELAQVLQNANLQRASAMTRLKQLTTVIFGPDRKGFDYAAGHSTTASETWALRKGDCLSLTVLAFAGARALRLDADMQEVQTPMTFDRNGRFDVLNEHVNLNVSLLRHSQFGNIEHAETPDVVIDFDPEVAPGRRGLTLTEGGILARYYNNIAVEHLTQDRPSLSYAHFRAAIHADPGYATPYANLAVLYRARGHDAEAEQLLRAALRLSPRPDLPLRALHALMQQQGRHAEAREFAAALAARQAYDPYYWTGMGLRHLQDGDAKKAVDALVRARELAPTFQEVRRYLALAYTRTGDLKAALAEQKVLDGMRDQTQLASLRKKLLQ